MYFAPSTERGKCQIRAAGDWQRFKQPPLTIYDGCLKASINIPIPSLASVVHLFNSSRSHSNVKGRVDSLNIRHHATHSHDLGQRDSRGSCTGSHRFTLQSWKFVVLDRRRFRLD